MQTLVQVVKIGDLLDSGHFPCADVKMDEKRCKG